MLSRVQSRRRMARERRTALSLDTRGPCTAPTNRRLRIATQHSPSVSPPFLQISSSRATCCSRIKGYPVPTEAAVVAQSGLRSARWIRWVFAIHSRSMTYRHACYRARASCSKKGSDFARTSRGPPRHWVNRGATFSSAPRNASVEAPNEFASLGSIWRQSSTQLKGILHA